MAEMLVPVLTEAGIKDVRIWQVKPTARDLAETQDQAGHLEIWFAAGALN
jgi:hypothetical protein